MTGGTYSGVHARAEDEDRSSRFLDRTEDCFRHTAVANGQSFSLGYVEGNMYVAHFSKLPSVKARACFVLKFACAETIALTELAGMGRADVKGGVT